MAQQGLDLTRIPFVVQYNKRDLPNAAPLGQLQEALNPGWPVDDPARQRALVDPNRSGEMLVQELDGGWVERVPYFEAVALRGDGVFDTLRAISKLVLKTIG
jgi:signal recognition particle receptor subunit beta